MERLFLWELCEGNLEGGLICWGLKKKKAPVMEHLSLCSGFVRGTWKGGGGFSLESLRDMSGKALEEEHLSLYRGSVRGTWREGYYTEDSQDTCNRRLWKRSIYFYRVSIRRTESEGSSNMFIGPEPVLDMLFCCTT
jgi:hypothetical protein